MPTCWKSITTPITHWTLWDWRFKGKTDTNAVNFLYTLEYASQDSTAGTVKNSADYWFAEGGIGLKGITAKLGYEVLGSDNGNYGFSTPLATLHAFNGWADQFLNTPAQGLEDLYIIRWRQSGRRKMVDRLPRLLGATWPARPSTIWETNLICSTYILSAKRYAAGIKYATYSAGDVAANKVDTDKLWVWMTASF